MKVLLVDDHAIVRDALRRLLAFMGEVEILEAGAGEAALSAVAAHDLDLIVLDLNLPGLGGLELLARLRSEAERAHVLVLTMNADPVYVRKALALKATGYVTKNASTDELLKAIRTVAAGEAYIEHALAHALAFCASDPSPLETLSQRELEILRLLGAGHSLGEIARIIGVAYKTVANTCSRMKTKCAVPRTLDLIRLADQIT